MGYQRLQVAVNISAQQFTQDNFEATVFDALAYSGLKPGYLELEITENIVMENVNKVVSKLNTLRARGIQIAIDDFGTGYSSLRYLEDLPLDTLKIDRSFVNKLNHNDPQHSLVNTIILMASSPHLDLLLTVSTKPLLPAQKSLKRLTITAKKHYTSPAHHLFVLP